MRGEVGARSMCRHCGKPIERRGMIWYAVDGTDICTKTPNGDHAPVDKPKRGSGRTAKQPILVGDIVVSSYRVSPFLSDETLRVVELVNVNTKTKPEWRVKCRSDRGVEGWIDGTALTVVGS
jgi:hypothetical protein